MISVIINTKDRLNDLCNCVRSIVQQTIRPNEIIIIDASVDYSDHEVSLRRILHESNIALKFLHTEAGNSFQRNVGINNLNIESKFVCFFDDDVVLSPDVIARYIAKFNSFPEIAAIQGVEINRISQNVLGKIVRIIFLIGYEGSEWKLLPSGEHVMLINPNKDAFVKSFMVGLTCVKREVLNDFAFDEWFKEYAFLEDYDFSFRIGKKFKMIISPEIRIVHNKAKSGRLNTFDTTRMFIKNKDYFYKKNMPRKLENQLAYSWSLVGHLVLNFGKSIYKRDPGYILGCFSGILTLVRNR